jgi:hypothetical protein
MKNYFASKTLIALAVAIAAAAGYETMANEQPMPPPAASGALPENIAPGSPVAEVVKLAQAGVDVSVIQTYISNCSNAFNLDADKIISLNDAGVPSDLVTAMYAHDKNFLAAINNSAPPAPASPPPTPAVVSGNSSPAPAAVSAPATEMTINNFNDTLTPYGQWVEVEGYGRCWRPTTVVYDSTWQPYCDRGRWVYTDCGWYWDSDYAWGVTFHYGRWFNNPRYGWCWWPDTVWAPSWVTWRSSGEYCGWAPLPPFTAYQPGIGFTYRGGNVSVSFGFGLAADCFTFVSIGNFCQPHPRYYCAPRQQVTQIYNQTTIINNYNSHNHTIVNDGISVTTIGAATHRPIQAVGVGTFANSNHHGWAGAGTRPGTSSFEHNGFNPADSHHQSSAPTHWQEPQTFNRGNVNPSAPLSSSPSAPANNAAPAHSQSYNSGFNNYGENHQQQHAYTAPTDTVGAPRNNPVSAPVNNTVGAPVNNTVGAPVNNMPSAPINQRSPAHGDFHQQLRQMSPQSSFATPSPATEHPQRTESHQNYSQTPPRNFAPVFSATAVPAQNQNSSPNGGRYPGWVTQGH